MLAMSNNLMMPKAVLKDALARLWAHLPGRLVRGVFGEFCPIFVLHRVAASAADPGQPRIFVESCLRLVRRYGFRPLSIDDLAQCWRTGSSLPPKSVVFTIDDGFTDHAEVAGEIFARNGVPLTCFVITDFLDRGLWPWDDQVASAIRSTTLEQALIELPDGTGITLDLRPHVRRATLKHIRDRLKQMPQDNLYEWVTGMRRALGVRSSLVPPLGFRPMTWQDARAFVAKGHAIAPHTCTHRILSRLSDEECRREIHGSVSRVQAELGRPCTVFAYPTGRPQDFGPREQQLLKEAGIVAAVATVPRCATPSDDLFALPRFPLPPTTADFLQYITFIERAKEIVRARGGGR